MYRLVISIFILWFLASCDTSYKKVECPPFPNFLGDSLRIVPEWQLSWEPDTNKLDPIYFYPMKLAFETGLAPDSVRKPGSVFGRGIVFDKKVINSEGELSVNGWLTLSHSQINNKILFTCDTLSDLVLKRVSFSKKVYFIPSPGFQDITFQECFIADTLYMGMTETMYRLSQEYGGLPEVKLSGPVLIEGTTFCAMPSFELTEFDSTFSLAGSKLYCDSLIFFKTGFKYTPNFSFVEFPRYLKFVDLKNKDWVEPLDLRSGKLASKDSAVSSKCQIKFACSKDFNPSYLDGGNFIIPSDRFDIQFDQGIPPWQQIVFLERLARKCQEGGLIESHKDWEIQKKKIYTNLQWPTIGPTINLLEQYLWFFGYSPVLLIYWMGLIFLAFWIINYLNIEKLLRNTYHDKNLGESFQLLVISPFSSNSNPLFRTKSERISYAFIFTASIYFGFRINHEAINYRNGKGMAYIYFMYVSGTAHLALAFALLVK